MPFDPSRHLLPGGLGLVAVALIGAGIWYFSRDLSPQMSETTTPSVDVATTAQQSSDLDQSNVSGADAGQSLEDQATGAQGVTDSSAATQTDAELSVALPEAPAPLSPPSFDVVRVEPTGDAVVAGRGPPGAVLTIYDNEQPLASATVDPRGEWVVVPERPLSPGDHELSLQAVLPDGTLVPSDQVVIVAVPYPQVAASETETEPTQEGTASADQDEGALAVLTTRSGEGGATPLQLPDEEPGITDGELALLSVDYDANGNAIIAGTATPGARLLLYIDNSLAGETRADDQGRWLVQPNITISMGLHNLRIDLLAEDLTVAARVESPFSRAELMVDLPQDSYVVVQPGNSLWRIARRTYGEGLRYSVIYGANQDQIRDPDLIYPGQIFLVPRLGEQG